MGEPYLFLPLQLSFKPTKMFFHCQCNCYSQRTSANRNQPTITLTNNKIKKIYLSNLLKHTIYTTYNK